MRSKCSIAKRANEGEPAGASGPLTGAKSQSPPCSSPLDDYFAEVLPDQKAAKIREVKARGLDVAMIGNGSMTRRN
jgi:hypothetical protein